MSTERGKDGDRERERGRREGTFKMYYVFSTSLLHIMDIHLSLSLSVSLVINLILTLMKTSCVSTRSLFKTLKTTS